MSILTGPEIARQVVQGRIKIDPFDPLRCGPNSYDLSWSDQYRVYNDMEPGLVPSIIHDFTLDSRGDNGTLRGTIDDGMVLRPGRLYLMSTMETVGSDFYVPVLETRSTLARLGVSVHLSAGFCDIGWEGQLTLEVTVIHPIRVYPFMSVCQVAFHTTEGQRSLYRDRKGSRYQGQRGPTAAKLKGGA